RRLGAPALRPFLQRPTDLTTQASHLFPERRPLQGTVPHSVPVVEQSMRLLQQPLADRFAFSFAIDHRLEIAAKMGPTDLAPPRRDPLVGTEPIAADDLFRLAPQQSFGYRARAVAGDGEDRGEPGHGHPEPGLL